MDEVKQNDNNRGAVLERGAAQPASNSFIDGIKATGAEPKDCDRFRRRQ
jgi:hypothetical protein